MLTLLIDYLLGWHIGWIRLVLTLRDVIVVFNGGVWLLEEAKRRNIGTHKD